MNRRKVIMSIAAATTVAMAIGYHVRGAQASGIPTANTLAYTGTLLNAGQPDDGQHFIQLNLWVAGGSAPACTTPANGKTQLSNGRFTIPLDPSCVPVVHQNPNVQVEAVIDGASMGKTALSAVPYAVEADTASNFAPGSAISNLVPPGTIVPYAGVVGGGVNPPSGWLLCDGTAVSRTTYANLFTGIGTGWGAGDGATTFNLPDLRGLFLRGVDPTAKNDPDASTRTASNPGGNTGAAVGTFEDDEFGSHNHGVNDPGHQHSLGTQTWGINLGNQAYAFGTNGSVNNNPPTNPSGTGISIQAAGGSETRSKNAAVNYIIKF